jgi:hypothetical protein
MNCHQERFPGRFISAEAGRRYTTIPPSITACAAAARRSFRRGGVPAGPEEVNYRPAMSGR